MLADDDDDLSAALNDFHLNVRVHTHHHPTALGH
jgi:hypothetical protein